MLAHIIFLIAVASISLLVDGFPPSSLRSARQKLHHASGMRLSRIGSTLYLSLYHEPHTPQIIIDAETLMAQVKKILTLKDIKSVLRPHTKISGTKVELLRDLGVLLGINCTNDGLYCKSKRDVDSKQRILEQRYKRMTVKELRAKLKARGAKVSGRKNELVQRLVESDHNVTCDGTESDDERNDADTFDDQDWSALEASISESNATVLINDEELPILSTLLFVNKPCGMSTLPTRQVEGYPNFPCLSELVKQWLSTNPVGIDLMKRAYADEDRYWKGILATLSQTSNAKLLRKKMRQYEKLQTKQSTFEPRPVHRLDIDTSGIVCIALTPYALRTAGMLFEQKSLQSGNPEIEATVFVDKRYVAMVEGKLHDTGEVSIISHGIGKVWVQDAQNKSAGHHEWACDVLDDESVAFCRLGDEVKSDPLLFVNGSVRDALSSYRVVDSLNNSRKTSRVELTPHTGRGHQLRLHMASLGHPIVGDSMHGRLQERQQMRNNELHLHATSLSMDCIVMNGDIVQRCKTNVSSDPWF